MKTLLNPAIQSYFILNQKNIDSWMLNPIQTQRKVLQDLITNAQYSQFGLQHEFASIFSIKNFKQKVPISEYEDYYHFINQIIQGEDHVIWNTPVEWFAKSSGTTNSKSKYIPISSECLEEGHYKASKDVLSIYFKLFPNSNLLAGKGLVVGGSHQLHPLNNQVNCGDLSAILLQNSPFWSTLIRTPDLSIALLDDWETKINKLAETTINENVTSLVGVPTWSLILLKKILDMTQKKVIKDVWPQFEVFIHGGVSFHPYKKQFQEILGDNVNFLEIYNASEGFFAIQDNLEQEGMLLLLDHGIFYEFMTLDEFYGNKIKTIGLNKVELKTTYVLIISTNSGLWRYIIGDTIEFTSLNPYRIIIKGRTKQFINAFGEELMVDNTDRAIEATCLQTNAFIKEYSVAPAYLTTTSKGYHDWLIEFEKEPPNIEEFSDVLDQNLMNLNSDYEAKRTLDMAILKPKITTLKQNTFHHWLKINNKLGGQHKIPRLNNNRDFLNEILYICNQN
ncbi:MAG: GH3 auxin-responsive promoter family protein [Alphaproteobacteria bacterium]|nr:GH3 auxin-responsive promoter family protein [Alphaproteobacteria bacterium]